LAISVGQVVRQPTLTLPADEKIGPCVTYSYCWLILASFENSPAARLEMQETALDTMKINDLREIGFVR
jgi:hypothetical protein